MGTNVKQTPIPVVPRNLKMVNADGTPTRSGQLLLEQLQASSTIFGTHDTRPAPGDAPSGALYFETDRGVLYSNENGNWQYVAGTMYGSLAPDQRPTDLGQYDGGFEFVANDTDPANRGRSFIWDGTEWIETTQVLYGTHSGRPAVADAPARCLYIEVDRSSVIYQNQGTAWEYIAGTMFGTISPDQRPTDLGPPDAGFDFRTNVDPAREFLWSGGEWVETTPIRYGTHAERIATPIAGLISGMFWTETDRGNVIYETQGGGWLFIAGSMWGTLSPDERPTDLGVDDDGFTFFATVSPLQEFIWASPVWVETTSASGSYQIANGTAALGLTTSPAPVPGATLTLTRTGIYAVRAGFDFSIAVGDLGQPVFGQVSAGGAILPGMYVILQSPSGATGLSGMRSSVGGEWTYTAATVGIVLQAVAFKNGGTGGSFVNGPPTWISATWISS